QPERADEGRGRRGSVDPPTGPRRLGLAIVVSSPTSRLGREGARMAIVEGARMPSSTVPEEALSSGPPASKRRWRAGSCASPATTVAQARAALPPPRCRDRSPRQHVLARRPPSGRARQRSLEATRRAYRPVARSAAVPAPYD